MLVRHCLAVLFAQHTNRPSPRYPLKRKESRPMQSQLVLSVIGLLLALVVHSNVHSRFSQTCPDETCIYEADKNFIHAKRCDRWLGEPPLSLVIADDQQEQSQPTSSVTHTIPFKLTEANNLVVSCMLNETDALELMFHTANSDVVVTCDAAKRLTSIQFEKSAAISSWGGESSARVSEGNTLQLSSLSSNNVRIFEDQHSGPGTDGKFGPDLFGNRIIEIDFDQSLLKLHDRLPDIGDGYQKLDLTIENGMWFCEGTVGTQANEHAHRFLIHSGFGSSVLLDDAFVQANELQSKLKVLSESQLTDSIGNVLKTQKVELPLLQIGNCEFRNVPTQIFDGAIRQQKISLIGGELLKKFNLIVDAPGGSIYWKPNRLFDGHIKEP